MANYIAVESFEIKDLKKKCETVICRHLMFEKRYCFAKRGDQNIPVTMASFTFLSSTGDADKGVEFGPTL